MKTINSKIKQHLQPNSAPSTLHYGKAASCSIVKWIVFPQSTHRPICPFVPQADSPTLLYCARAGSLAQQLIAHPNMTPPHTHERPSVQPLTASLSTTPLPIRHAMWANLTTGAEADHAWQKKIMCTGLTDPFNRSWPIGRWYLSLGTVGTFAHLNCLTYQESQSSMPPHIT